MPAAPTDELATAATRARGALGASHQMKAMLSEYTELEAQHAARLHALAQRMGDCVNGMRLPEQDEPGPERDDGLHSHQSRCVAVMDQVVTFLTRYGSMHCHLSECLASDLFAEWSEILSQQQKRMDAREPELSVVGADLEESEKVYGFAHVAFNNEFERACTVYAKNATVSEDLSSNTIAQGVQDLLEQDPDGVDQQSRTCSPSKAMQYVGSLSRRLLKSGDSRRQTGAQTDNHAVREVSAAIARAERLRQQCLVAFQHMQRLHVRHTRLCDSLRQEYSCVESECFASMRSNIRKLVVHVSAFTSNLQYDATQLFQDIEVLQDSDLKCVDERHPSMVRESLLLPRRPPPPQDVPLGLEHIVRRRFPVADSRPHLLKHQNACHVLSLGID